MVTLDYLNTNSLRNYPIKDGCSRTSVDGLFTIPNSLIVDLVLCNPGTVSLSLYISAVSVSPTNLSIEISDQTLGEMGVFQTTLPLTNYNTDLSLIPGSNFPSATGNITIGSGDDLVDLVSGNFIFSYTATTLLMRVYSPSNPGLSWISFSDVKGNTSTQTGYVQIDGHSNIQFRLGSGVVYIDAGEDLGLNKICVSNQIPITTINGVPPNSDGNFTLIPEQCVALTTAQFGLSIADNCGQTCLGCTAIETLTTQVNSLETSVINIRNFTNNLQAAITQATTLLNYQCQC
jgi:hypothetical protein